MRANLTYCLSIACFTIALFSCKKETEVLDGHDYEAARLAEILPLQVGKTITYQTDSLVFTNFNRNEEIHSYIEKDTIDNEFLDAMGRTSYRVTRFMQDLNATRPWFSSGTYFITPTASTVEINENNLRFVKLALPLREGTTWSGNLYLPDEPYSTMYNFSNDNRMDIWDYTYSKVNDVFTYNSTTVNNVVTVTGIDYSNLADTITVSDNAVNVSGKTTVYIQGTATDSIRVSATTPTPSTSILALYNRTNQPLTLNGIAVPAGQGRTYEFVNGNWTYGIKDNNGNRIDVLNPELPFGSRSLMVDKYAPGIGLVYQEYTLWEYQYKISNGSDDGTKTGFGVKRRMINHN
jgi:hypothetical protein